MGRRLAVLVLASGIAASGCSGNGSGDGPTAPSRTSSPPTFHTISNTAGNVRYWFDFTPDRDARVVVNLRYLISIHCRSAIPADHWLIFRFAAVLRPSGAIVRPSVAPNIGIPMTNCVEGRGGQVDGRLEAPFGVAAQDFQVEVWLESPAPGQPAIPTGAPDDVFIENVNWMFSWSSG